MKLFVCYVPGLDARRITPEVTPRIHAMCHEHPTATLSTLPSTELLPTMLTGVYPRDHGVWQVRLRDRSSASRRRTLFERLPESVTTTIQGLRQLTDSSFDLATVPPHRRKAFEQFRFKYTRRETSDRMLMRFGSYDTILGRLGHAARYEFAKRFEKAYALLDGPFAARDDRALLFLELYALDLFQHWHLDRPDRMRWALAETDAFVVTLDAWCRDRGRTLMLLVDHGQEPVVGTIPLREELDQSSVPEAEYSYFMEVAQCRLWFHTERAREVLSARLGELSRTTLLHYREMGPYHLEFDDDAFAEMYLFADPGYIFFPHDFYRPLANVYLGLRDAFQRPRTFDARHRGNHGYLPQHPSEKGFVTLVSNDHYLERREGELIDVAPTVLNLLGLARPDHMRGAALFHERRPAGG